MSTTKILSDLTIFTKYARYYEYLGRRETYEEIVDRNKQMHLKKFKDNKELCEEIEEVFNKFVKTKKILPSMRSLQFGGKPIEVSPNRIYNCLASNTRFITSLGVKSFDDFNNGDIVSTLTHTGGWKRAIVKNYGKQKLNNITLKRGKSTKVITATANHRWLLSDESVTDSLQEKDLLITTPDTFQNIKYEDMLPEERLAWCYGYIFGDGTTVKRKDKIYSMVRLCDKDSMFADRFVEMGFEVSSPKSFKGDFVAYTGSYDKSPIDPSKDNLSMVKAFVRGYLDADGHRNPAYYDNNKASEFKGIQSSDITHINFIRDVFPIVGLNIIKEEDLTGQVTNYGKRPFTIKFSLSSNLTTNEKMSHTRWSVSDIEETDRYEDVWCLEVEGDKSFILDGGIVTGNCCYLPADDYRAFSESMFLLLGGTGVGYSVQKAHVAKLLPIRKPLKTRRYLVADSIEGWADAVKALFRAYMEGRPLPKFDFSDIREKGAPLVTSGGKAPGPQPLHDCLHNIKKILDAKEDGAQLTTLEAHDIMCYIADAVLAGGIRRAACISLFDMDDEEMLTCKSGAWYELNPQRGRANNSTVILRHKIKKREFMNLWKKIEASGSGEPGLYFTNNAEWGTNPSLRRGTKVMTSDGIFPIEQLQDKEFEVKNLNGEISKAKCWLSGKGKRLYKLNLVGGHEYYATAEHEWPIWDGESYVKVKTPDINDNSYLPIIQEDKLFDGDLGTYEDGFAVGWQLGDGTLHKRSDNGRLQHTFIVAPKDDQYGISDRLSTYLAKVGCNATFRENQGVLELSTVNRALDANLDKFGADHKSKGLPSRVWDKCSENFRKGIIDALFSSDGCVDKKDKRIIFSSSHKQLIDDVSELLGFYGIRTIKKERLTKAFGGEFTGWQLLIQDNASIKHFKDIFRLSVGYKQDIINSYKFRDMEYKKQIKVLNVEETDLYEDVWDISVQDDTHCFQIAHCITGNCCEIALRPFQFCNLCEINMGDIESQEDLNERAKAAAFVGTLQASYTDFHYLRDIWKKTTEKDALIGVSGTGVASGEFAKYDLVQASEGVVTENVRVADIIGINHASRTTCVKPAGTSSMVVGSSSGIHGWHAQYFIRRMRLGKNEALYKFMEQFHPELVEDDFFKPTTQAVLSIPVEAPKGAILRTETPLQLLERVKLFHEDWVRPGHIKGDNTHNISATVSIKDDEWKDVGEWMWTNREAYNGLSVLPYDGGTYVQAPFEEISMQKYHAMVKHIQSVDLTKVKEDGDYTDLKGEIACAGGVCEI